MDTSTRSRGSGTGTKVSEQIAGLPTASDTFIPDSEIVDICSLGGYDLVKLDALDAPDRVAAARACGITTQMRSSASTTRIGRVTGRSMMLSQAGSSGVDLAVKEESIDGRSYR